jgi:OmpA-OmpF porin, OOP family
MRRSGHFLPLLAGLTLLVQPLIPAAQAQPLDPESIVRALTPKPKPMPTRSILGPSRGIAIEGGEQAAEALPSIDLHVPFEYDQSAITMSDAQIVIDSLAKALKDERLAKMRFQIVGHTDARGTDAHNDELSARRAQAVLKRLVDFHKVDAGRLQATGRGRRELKDPSRPDDGINRRVQIRTLDSPSS